jgi:hypothetical protein
MGCSEVMKIKKAVILGNTKSPMGRKEPYSWFVLTYTQGLKLNNIDVHHVDYKSNSLKQIKNKIIDIKPDVVFTHLSFHSNLRPTHKVLQMQRDIIQACNPIFVHVMMDAYRDDRYMGDVSDAFHIAFVGNHEILERGRKAWNIPTHYSPYSALCYDEMAKPSKDLAFKEPIFTGSPYLHPDRSDFIRRLLKKIPLRIFQTQTGNDLRHRTPELSVSSSSILGLCTGYDITGYHNVRYWQFLGTGACLIARRFSNTKELIPDDLYFGFDGYTNGDVNKVIEYHKRSIKEDTTRMRVDAFNFIQKYHNCGGRIKDIIDVIEGKKELTKNAYNFNNFI